MKDNSDTLAKRLGINAHISPLLQKAKRLGICQPSDFEEIAIARGLRYYGRPSERLNVCESRQIDDLNEADFSNEELAIALMSPALPYSLNRLRMAGAVLGMPNLSLEKILILARMERCESTVRYIAELAHEVEPNQHFWQSLIANLPPVVPTPPDVLPHPSRFVAMSGYDRTGRVMQRQWIRPLP
jgi:hypothetical protein